MRGIAVAATCLVACSVFASSAAADEISYRFAAQAGVEYASGLPFDDDGLFFTPPKRVKDFRYTYELSAGATYAADFFTVDASYKFDQRTYDDYDLFHRRRHDAILNISTDAFWNIDLGVRYRYRRSLPEGPLGTIESDQLRLRAEFPEYPYAPAAVRVTHSAYMFWQTTDFHKLRFLDSELWETGSNLGLVADSGGWTADLGVAYGIRDARLNQASNVYADYSLEVVSEAMSLFALGWLGPISLELDLDYREEWYEGLGSDKGTQRHDRIAGVELTARRQWTDHLSTFARAGFDDHESNFSGQNFDEAQITLGIRFEY